MAQASRPPKAALAVPKERAAFTSLLAKNVNYFGNLAVKTPKLVKKIVGDTTFEQLTCVGFHPPTNTLDATIAIKRPTGYNGDLCKTGSTEFVRFYLDYGAGWEDQGLAGTKVHDIADGKDCAGKPEKPLTYVASLRIDPHRRCCSHAVLPRVRAILSWQWAPPAGAPNWTPVWGNVHECEIQIAPRPWDIFCLFEDFDLSDELKVKIPQLVDSTVPEIPIPLPDPPPLALHELAEAYAAPKKAKAAHAVEPHRFGLTALQALSAPAAGFDSVLAGEQAKVWGELGYDLGDVIGALEQTKADVSYEELECVGLEESWPERLVATFKIKRAQGYSGDLCHAGSKEHVAFWADFGDSDCRWTYLGTSSVTVHDIADIPAGGLCYSAILPFDADKHRRGCEKPRIVRVRAVLSWQVPPSTTDPDDLTVWGNRLDTHVQIAPGEPVDPLTAAIRNLGGIAVEDIDTAGSGLTLAADVRFAHHPSRTADGWGLQRPCPFGGEVNIEGNFLYGYWYRVKVRRASDPPTSFTTLGDSFLLERAYAPGYDTKVSTNGFFEYSNPVLYFNRLLAVWNSGSDDVWEIQLDVSTAPNDASIVASSPWYAIAVDNTAPSADIHISTGGGDCADFDAGTTFAGTFHANDAHFGAWSLGTEPNTASTPSNQPRAVPALAATTPVAGTHVWEVDTAPPPAGLVTMKPCGYVARIVVSDRSILNSHPDYHNTNHTSVGLCLRQA